MSYCRFGADSEVYMVNADDIICVACKLQPLVEVRGGGLSIRADKEFKSVGAAIAHLNVHEKAGHKVPKRAYTRLIEELVGDDDMVPRKIRPIGVE